MVGARTGWAVVGRDGLLSTGTALAEGGQGSEVAQRVRDGDGGASPRGP